MSSISQYQPRPNNSQDNLFYRPQIQLDCCMTRTLVKEQAFVGTKLVVGDVGVGLGFDRFWDLFANQCLQIGFDPDAEECARIEAEYATRESLPLPRERVESIALWDSVGKKQFVRHPVPLHLFMFPTQPGVFSADA